jgi:hypothetical protein
MMYRSNRASTDRLKRVQHLPCFATSPSDPEVISFDSTLGGPCLRIGNPIAVLVRCEEQTFLAIAQVNRISFASERNLHELGLHFLADPSAKVDFQILRLVPATILDDPEQQYDWCWSFGMDVTCEAVVGRFLHPVNPAVSVRTGKPAFLFDSSFLLTMAASLYQELLPHDLYNLPEVKRSEWFPYRHSGMYDTFLPNFCLIHVVWQQVKPASFAKMMRSRETLLNLPAHHAQSAVPEPNSRNPTLNGSSNTWRHIFYMTLVSIKPMNCAACAYDRHPCAESSSRKARGLLPGTVWISTNPCAPT